MDEKYEHRSEDNKKEHVDENQGKTVITGFHIETTESEVTQLLREMINEIGMDFGRARIECLAKPITHAFIHFMDNGDRNKFIRSANMLKKELRGRKVKLTRSMDAEERFHNKRLGFVKYCIHTRHNIPLSLISLNWTAKHVSVKGQAGKYDDKHGVGIMLNKRWRKRIIDTEYINERAITATIVVNRQRIKLMSVYFTHSKNADHHIEKMYKTIEKHMRIIKNTFQSLEETSMLSWDLVKERNVKVLAGTLSNESNKRGDWLNIWLMLNDYSALNTMFRKTPHKQTSFVSPKGKEKQIDYILTKRRYLRNVKDAEANDMIHMGSDHRCIMATFLINTPGKNTHARRENKKHETIRYVEHKKKAKNTKAAANKGNEVHDTGNNAKDQVERENAAAADAESTLVEAVAQEIERRSMKRSSKVANQRCVPAQHEHGRQDGWTSTPRGRDDGKKGSERDKMTGERLQNQRPHPLVRIEDEEDAHEVDTGNGCSGGLLAGERLPKQRPLGDEHPEHNSEEHLGAQVPHQVEEAGSIGSIPAATRACSRTTTKKHR